MKLYLFILIVCALKCLHLLSRILKRDLAYLIQPHETKLPNKAMMSLEPNVTPSLPSSSLPKRGKGFLSHQIKIQNSSDLSLTFSGDAFYFKFNEDEYHFKEDLICAMDVYTLLVSKSKSPMEIAMALKKIFDSKSNDPVEMLVALLQFDLVIMYLNDTKNFSVLDRVLPLRNPPEDIPIFWKISNLLRLSLNRLNRPGNGTKANETSAQLDSIEDSCIFCDVIESYEELAREAQVYNLQVYCNLRIIPLILMSERANEADVCPQFHDRWALAVSDLIMEFPANALVKILFDVLSAPVVRKNTINRLLTLANPFVKMITYLVYFEKLSVGKSLPDPNRLIETFSPENLFIYLESWLGNKRTISGAFFGHEHLFNSDDDILKTLSKNSTDPTLLGAALAFALVKGIQKVPYFTKHLDKRLIGFLLNPDFHHSKPSPLAVFIKKPTECQENKVHASFWTVLIDVFGENLIKNQKVLKSIEFFFNSKIVSLESELNSIIINTNFLNHSFNNSALREVLLSAIPSEVENVFIVKRYDLCNANFFDFDPNNIELLAKVLYKIVTSKNFLPKLNIDFLKTNYSQDLNLSLYFPFYNSSEFQEKLSQYGVHKVLFPIEDLLYIYLCHLRQLVGRIKSRAISENFDRAHIQCTQIVQRRGLRYDYVSPAFVFSYPSIHNDTKHITGEQAIFDFIERNFEMMHGIDLNTLSHFIETKLTSEYLFLIILFRDFVQTYAIFTQNKCFVDIMQSLESKFAKHVFRRFKKPLYQFFKKTTDYSYEDLKRNLDSIGTGYRDRFHLMIAIIVCEKNFLTKSDIDFIIGAFDCHDKILIPVFDLFLFNLVENLPPEDALYFLKHLPIHKVHSISLFLEEKTLDNLINFASLNKDHFMMFVLSVNSVFFDEYYKRDGHLCKDQESEEALIQKIILDGKVYPGCHFSRIASVSFEYIREFFCKKLFGPKKPKEKEPIFVYEINSKKEEQIDESIAGVPSSNDTHNLPHPEAIDTSVISIKSPKHELYEKLVCKSNGQCFFKLKGLNEKHFQVLSDIIWEGLPFCYDLHKFEKLVQSKRFQGLLHSINTKLLNVADIWSVKPVKKIKFQISGDKSGQMVVFDEKDLLPVAIGRLKSLIKYSNTPPRLEEFIRIQFKGKEPYIASGILHIPEGKLGSLADFIYKLVFIDPLRLSPQSNLTNLPDGPIPPSSTVNQHLRRWLDHLKNPTIYTINSSNFETMRQVFLYAINNSVSCGIDFEMTGLHPHQPVITNSNAEFIQCGVSDNHIIQGGVTFISKEGNVTVFLLITAPNGILTKEMFVKSSYEYLTKHGLDLSMYEQGKALVTEKQTAELLSELFRKTELKLVIYSGYADFQFWLKSMNYPNYLYPRSAIEVLFSQNERVFYDLKMLQEAITLKSNCHFEGLEGFSKWLFSFDSPDQELQNELEEIFLAIHFHNAAWDSLLTLAAFERLIQIGRIPLGTDGKKLSVNSLVEELKNRLWIHPHDGLRDSLLPILRDAGWNEA